MMCCLSYSGPDSSSQKQKLLRVVLTEISTNSSFQRDLKNSNIQTWCLNAFVEGFHSVRQNKIRDWGFKLTKPNISRIILIVGYDVFRADSKGCE